MLKNCYADASRGEANKKGESQKIVLTSFDVLKKRRNKTTFVRTKLYRSGEKENEREKYPATVDPTKIKGFAQPKRELQKAATEGSLPAGKGGDTEKGGVVRNGD